MIFPQGVLDCYPPPNDEMWVRATSRVLKIDSERVTIDGYLQDRIPRLQIDNIPFGKALLQFTSDQPGRSRFGLVGAILQECRKIVNAR